MQHKFRDIKHMEKFSGRNLGIQIELFLNFFFGGGGEGSGVSMVIQVVFFYHYSHPGKLPVVIHVLHTVQNFVRGCCLFESQ